MFNKQIAVLAPLLCILFVGLIAFMNPPKAQPMSDAERTSRLLKTFERLKKVPPTGIGVVEPIIVIESDIFADGGSTFVRFLDSHSVEFMTTKWSSFDNPVERCRYHHFTVVASRRNADVPSIAGEGDGRDRTIYALLCRWADQDPEFHALLKMNSARFRDWLHRMYSTDSRTEKYSQLRAKLFAYNLLAKVSRVEF